MKLRLRTHYFWLLTVACLSLACDRQPASNLPTASIAIGKKTYMLEIAARGFEREHGLMQRDSMPADHGMIFVFPDAQQRNFWMKDTRIPLDIVFLNPDATVVSVHQMKAYSWDEVPSELPAKYAIELNAGQTAESGVKVGDILQLPDAVKTAKADP